MSNRVKKEERVYDHDQYKFYSTLNYIVGVLVGSILIVINAPWYILILGGLIGGGVIGVVMGIYEVIRGIE